MGLLSFRSLWDSCGWHFIMICCAVVFFYIWKYESQYNNDGTYTKHFNYSPHKSHKKRAVTRMSKGETACREFLEKTFRKPFPSVRPEFLYNDATGENLELDMYNRSELLACEYNGKQHYEYTPYLHKNNKLNFVYQQYRDNLKREICQKLGIKLITVPYTVPIKDIPLFLMGELRRYGYQFR
mgnify:CR=1 FL=1